MGADMDMDDGRAASGTSSPAWTMAAAMALCAAWVPMKLALALIAGM